MSHVVVRSLDRVSEQLARLQALTADQVVFDARRLDCSRWSVGRQLDHVERASRATFDRVDQLLADPAAAPPQRLTAVGRIVLISGWIPRGVGKAPRATRPDEAARDRVQLGAAFERLADRTEGYRARIEGIAAGRSGARHPYFGLLGPAKWMRFTAVHQNHHLKIVGRILR